MQKIYIILCSMFISGSICNAQQWQQTTSIPEGSGITDLVVRQSNGNIFATTASYDWPNGQDGGVFRSQDYGETWEKLFDAYVGRTILDGHDGNLYATVWDYPYNEAIYRSTDNGDNWAPIVVVPEGNNIFSIALGSGDNDGYMYAGTRTGILRSADFGVSWNYANTGMQSDAWVSDLKVDYNGVIAAATDKGLYLSYDYADSWQEAEGVSEDDTATQIAFKYDIQFDLTDNFLMVGTAKADFYMSGSNNYSSLGKIDGYGQEYTAAKVENVTVDDEGDFVAVSSFSLRLKSFKSSAAGAGFYLSTDDWATSQQYADGLPSDPVVSSVSGAVVYPDAGNGVVFYMGLYENTPGGAKVYSLTIDNILGIGEKDQAKRSGNQIHQNFPNPFQHSTTISYYMEKSEEVSINLYAIDGSHVSSLLYGWQSQGKHEFTFDSQDIESGIFYYRMESEGSSEIKKMIVIK